MVWTVLLVFSSFAVIVVSLLTSGDSKAFSGALVGSADLDLFFKPKVRGTKKWLNRLMFFLGFALMLTAILVKVSLK